MTSSESRLLTIPREIRDKIYSYLSRELVLDWEYEVGPIAENDRSMTKYNEVEVRVHNLPFFDVLLACTRLRDEYEAAECFTDLAVTIYRNYDSPRSRRGRTYQKVGTPVSEASQLFEHILARVCHVTMFFQLVSELGSTLRDRNIEQATVSAFTTLVLKKTRVLQEPSNPEERSKLKTVRIALQEELDIDIINDDQLDDILAPPASRTNFLVPPKDIPASFPLLQRGEGYRVGYNSVHSRNPDDPGNNSRSNMLCHDVHKLGVYLYAKEDVTEKMKHYWDADEIVEQWPLTEYPERELEPMLPEKANTMRRYPQERQQWVEKRGIEDAKAWIETSEQPNV